MSSSLSIVHRPEMPAFIVERDGQQVGELAYSVDGDIVTVTHTGVDRSVRHQGAAKQLVKAVVNWARAERKGIRPVCSYARAEIARTPAYQDVVVS